jgi:IclR family acetate operon transcriptional repressor
VLTSVSRQRLRFEHPAGSGIGLHASAMGKAVLAFSTSGIAAAVAELPDLECYTDATITSASALEEELDRVRELGYAVNREERYDGVCGVGAPVLNRFGVAEAAIGVQGPSVRMLGGGLDAIGPLVRRAADGVAEVVLRARSA